MASQIPGRLCMLQGTTTHLVAVAVHPDLLHKLAVAKVVLQLLSSHILPCSQGRGVNVKLQATMNDMIMPPTTDHLISSVAFNGHTGLSTSFRH